MTPVVTPPARFLFYKKEVPGATKTILIIVNLFSLRELYRIGQNFAVADIHRIL